MKRVFWMGLCGLAAFATACSDTTTPAAATPPVAVGGACTDASPNTCSADKKALLTCDTATKKFKEKEVCASGSQCAVTGGVAGCPGAADATAGGDAAADTGSIGTDTGKDAAPDVKDTKDSGPPKPAKCDQADNACFDACVKDQCKNEFSACTDLPECATITVCFGNCQKGVSPPEDVTGTTCPEKCLSLASAKGKAAYGAISLCGIDSCVVCDKGKPGYENCVNGCVSAKCGEQLANCDKVATCAAVFTCLNEKKCTQNDQKCIQDCVGLASDSAGKTALNAVAVCLQDASPLCQ